MRKINSCSLFARDLSPQHQAKALPDDADEAAAVRVRDVVDEAVLAAAPVAAVVFDNRLELAVVAELAAVGFVPGGTQAISVRDIEAACAWTDSRAHQRPTPLGARDGCSLLWLVTILVVA